MIASNEKYASFADAHKLLSEVKSPFFKWLGVYNRSVYDLCHIHLHREHLYTSHGGRYERTNF